MSLNSTPRSERYHIAIFGCRNAGKSSLLNAIANQDLAVVSPEKGTTTDPVYKSMEILPLGPCVLIDTPGLDDQGDLGMERIGKAKNVLMRSDAAIFVIDAKEGETEEDREILRLIEERKIPCIIVYNKCDEVKDRQEGLFYVSAKTGEGIEELRKKISALRSSGGDEKHIISDLIKPHSLVVLVIPIDGSAPKGRIILPQQQVIRDLLDSSSFAVTTKEGELSLLLDRLGRKPDLVITDSQVFGLVAKIVPPEIPLTSFSILMARYKGFLETAVKGVSTIGSLHEGDRILIAEGCTHHRHCEDIGTVKIPKLLEEKTGKRFSFEFTSGYGYPEDLSGFSLIIHCGACMLNEKEVMARMEKAGKMGVPFTNYGTVLSYLNGILERSLKIFPALNNLI